MDEKRLLRDLNIKKFVHIHEEVGKLLVEDAITYSKIKQEQKS
jgi:CPA2 family monovalent cation:H+ antiporter-2